MIRMEIDPHGMLLQIRSDPVQSRQERRQKVPSRKIRVIGKRNELRTETEKMNVMKRIMLQEPQAILDIGHSNPLQLPDRRLFILQAGKLLVGHGLRRGSVLQIHAHGYVAESDDGHVGILLWQAQGLGDVRSSMDGIALVYCRISRFSMVDGL